MIRVRFPNRSRPGYTLVELLIATLLTLMLMAAVAGVFGTVSESINNTRALMEKTDQLRGARERLASDLATVSAPIETVPRWYDPKLTRTGYLQYTEGPIGPLYVPDASTLGSAHNVFLNSAMGEIDTTVGDVDDMLMFTVARDPAKDKPFVGRVLQLRAPRPGEKPDGSNDPDGSGPLSSMDYVIVRTAESYQAEVAWFVRGRTLYRRVLLVLPGFDADLRTTANELQLDPSTLVDVRLTTPNPYNPGPGFFAQYDISVRYDPATSTLTPNSFADLAKPENRYAHRTRDLDNSGNRVMALNFPFHPHIYRDWRTSASGSGDTPKPGPAPRNERTAWSMLGLPTLRETSYFYQDAATGSVSDSWYAGGYLPAITQSGQVMDTLTIRDMNATGQFDLWANPHPWGEQEPTTGAVIYGGASNNPRPYLGGRTGEDIILTNVVGFDVKAWDPGAPVLNMNIGGTNRIIMPGDPAYLRELPSSTMPSSPSNPVERVSYGAFVDLNFMGRLALQTFGASDPQHADVRAKVGKPSYYNTIQTTGEPEPWFYGAGDYRSGLRGHVPDANDLTAWDNPDTTPVGERYGDIRSWALPSVYDTWSNHYESDGLNQDNDGLADEGSNGLDDPVVLDINSPQYGEHRPTPLGTLDYVADDPDERETSPPYPVALQGLQIKIRVYEPDSRKVRETTIVHEFMDQ